jgi:hypothetical protein
VTTIAEARAAVADAVTAETGLRMVPYLSDNIPIPCGMLQSLAFDPRYVLGRAAAVYPFRLSVYVGRTAELASQKALDLLREPTGGICSALEAMDESVVQNAYVTQIGELMAAATAGDQYMVCDFEIEVTF